MKRLLFFVLLIWSLKLTGQNQFFTREDSLRGMINAERKWWDVVFYHLDIAVQPDNKSIEGTVKVTYQVLEPHQVLQIDLQPPLTIQNITQDEQSLTFRKDGRNAYIVDLRKEQQSKAVESIIIYYSGHPLIARNPPWEGGFQFGRDKDGNHFIATSCQGLGASAWWPCKDHSYDEPDSMLMSITVPEHLQDISNGRLRKITDNSNGTKTFEWFVQNPINNYGVNVNIGNYVHFTDTVQGVNGILDMDFYVLPYNLEKAREQFKQAKLMLKAFEYWFGPYPFYEDGYKLVEVPYLGMEHQSSVTYGNGYQNGYKGKDLSGTGWGLKWDFIIIHESGHEWFANNITYRDIADMWIHESFTNYSETLFTEYYYGKEAGTDYVVGTRKDIKNDIPIIGIYNVNKRGSGDMYPKGGNMLHTIRHSMDNDELFRQVLRGLNTEFFHQTVATGQIENYISEKANYNYQPVFDQYLRTVNVPVFEYYFKNKKVFYRWSNVVPNFNLPLVLDKENVYLKVIPSEEWSETNVNKNQKMLIRSPYIERMYYVTTRKVKGSGR
jgi:aminopeptidase N